MNDPSRAPPALESTAAARALWSALDAAANPLSMLIMLAGLVRSLDATDYGILTIALAASGISMALNPAMAVTTTKFVSELAGKGSDRPQAVAGAIATVLTAVTLIDLLLLSCAALWREPLTAWLFGEAIPFPGQHEVLLLAMLAVGIQQIDAVVAAAIRGLERFRRQTLIEIGMRAVLTAVVVAAAWLSASVPVILAAQCMVYGLFLLLRLLALRALLPGQRLFGLSSREQVLLLLRYGGWMWLSAVAGVAYTSGDRIIVGRVLGAAAAGRYNIYVQLTQIIHFVPSSLFAFSLPAFSRLNAREGTKFEVSRAYKTYLFIVCAIALALTVILLTLWPFLLRSVIGNQASSGGPDAATQLLAGNFLLLAVSVIPYYLLLALGRSRMVSITTSSSMLVTLVLMTVLIPRFGLQGAAAARLAYGMGSLGLFVGVHRLLKPA